MSAGTHAGNSPREQAVHLPHGRGHVAVKVWPGVLPNSEPVLAVHGWMDNAATFDRLAPLLPQVTWHAMDLAGHGLSDPRPDGYRYHNADYLDDLLAVMDAIAPDRPLRLLGHSLGAGLCLLLAGIFPERVSRLVLIEGLGPLTATPDDYASQARDALDSWRRFQPGRRIIPDMDAAVQARMNGLTGALSEPAARLLCERSLRQESGTLSWRTDKRLRQSSLMRFSEAQVLSCIRAITAPTLLVRGESGMPFDHALAQARVAAFRDLAVVSLPGGHHLHLDESPEAVAAAIAGFWAD